MDVDVWDRLASVMSILDAESRASRAIVACDDGRHVSNRLP